MVNTWQREEYSHSYLIPFIALILIVQRVPDLSRSLMQGSWAGVSLIAIMLAFLLLGESIGILTGMFGQQVGYRNGSVAFWLHERVKPLCKYV